MDVDDAAKKLKDLRINKDLSVDLLNAAKSADKLKGSADEVADGIKNVAKSTDIVDDLGNAFKGLGVQIGSALKALAMNPITWLVGATAVTMGLVYHEATKFKRAMEEAAEAQSKYAESSAELKGLNSELDNTNNRIDELKSKGTLTLAEEGELEKLL